MLKKYFIPFTLIKYYNLYTILKPIKQALKRHIFSSPEPKAHKVSL